MSRNLHNPPTTGKSRLGFHYYPDTLHYRESDLLTWLPELKSLGASWLTLVAPLDRAIPEPFLRGLIDAGIEPVLHFNLPFSRPYQEETLGLLFRVYASWGVRYVVLFDRPNQRKAWPVSSWAQSDLVERFLDLFLPTANAALGAGLIPVFPPLEPGGDYWDTAFLRAALQGMHRRGESHLLEALVLSAYAWVNERPLNWGAGGPERWPGVRPYDTPENQQDQRSFYIFDWYLADAQAVLGEPRPILLLGAGRRPTNPCDPFQAELDELEHARINVEIARRIITSSVPPATGTEISPYLLTCNFWLLAAAQNDPLAAQAWFQPDGYSLPVVGAFRQLITSNAAAEPNNFVFPLPEITVEPSETLASFHTGTNASAAPDLAQASQSEAVPAAAFALSHYMLLPLYDCGAAEWHLDAARPFILKYHPTIGYSPEEASAAKRITVIGGEQVFPEALLETFRLRGCQVERICGDGTEIATQLASA